jgi:hypothetical protein
VTAVTATAFEQVGRSDKKTKTPAVAGVMEKLRVHERCERSQFIL